MGLIFFLIHNFDFESFILIDPLMLVLILNVPSFIVGSLFYLIKKRLFWIFYTLIFIIITSLLSAWSAIEIYTGGDWGNTGGNTNNSGSGGVSGRAIFGARYSVVGANSSTIKGAYNP